MNYLFSIKTAIIMFPFIALLFSFPFILHNYHKYGSINPFRVLIIYSFILYLITIYFLIILPLPNKNDIVYKPNMINLIPFKFITDFIKETSFILKSPNTYLKALLEPCFYTVIFNIFMTIPFGMYLKYYFKYNLKKTIIISFMLSLFFELTQITGLYGLYSYPYRVFDIDDILMNISGSIFGYSIFGIIDKFLPSRDKIDEESIRIGKVVSGFRRITIFILDLLLYILISIFLNIFIKTNLLFLITFIIYYIIYPYLTNGTTLGSKFLNVKLVYNKYRFIKITFRIIFLFIYYFGLIFLSFNLMFFISNKLNLDIIQEYLLLIFNIIGILIFYLINIYILLRYKKIYYDNFFKVKYISTIFSNY